MLNVMKYLPLAALALLSNPASAQYINGYTSSVYLFGNSAAQTGPNADISYMNMYDQSTFDHDGGSVSWAYLYNQSTENVRATQSWLHTYDKSTVTIGSGANMSWLVMAGQSTAVVTGGNLSWAVVGGNANATLDLSNGATVGGLWFANSGGSAVISGYGLVATQSVVSGQSATGTPFSINVTFTPCDWGVGCSGTPIDAANYSGLQLINLGSVPPPPPVPGAVPEAPTWAMLILGFGFVGAHVRGRRKVMRRLHAG